MKIRKRAHQNQIGLPEKEVDLLRKKRNPQASAPEEMMGIHLKGRVQILIQINPLIDDFGIAFFT